MLFRSQDLPSGKILYKGLSKDGVYPIPSPSTLSSSPTFNFKSTISASNSIKSDVLLLWHYSYEIAKYDDNLFLVILLTPVLNVPNAKIKSQIFVNSLSSLLTLSLIRNFLLSLLVDQVQWQWFVGFQWCVWWWVL